MSIAIIPIGYADGLFRILGNGRGRIYVHGKQQPIVGNICMDMCMIDVTGLDVKEGDIAVVFGEKFPIQNIATAMETIPYEVLTSVSRRVKRVYYYE
jgi:Alr-MurF fusion protein